VFEMNHIITWLYPNEAICLKATIWLGYCAQPLLLQQKLIRKRWRINC